MLVVGGGATGVQLASIFGAFGTRVQLFEAGPRLLATANRDVSVAVATAFRASGNAVHEDFGRIESFDGTPGGVRMVFSKNGGTERAEAAIVVVAIGWVADTAGLDLAAAGVELEERDYVRVDDHLRTSAPHIFAAGDITGRLMLVPHAFQDGFVGLLSLPPARTPGR
jgi:pyruvate/2-oxoglutarate dehydrogenase complex dihydrolipoamide dehydrogenase (E3) component